MCKDGVLITLNKDRLLRLSYKAIKLYKTKFGKDIAKIGDNFEMGNIAEILYVALVQEEQSISFEALEDLIDEVPLDYLIKKVEELLEVTFPKKEKEIDPNEEALTATN